MDMNALGSIGGFISKLKFTEFVRDPLNVGLAPSTHKGGHVASLIEMDFGIRFLFLDRLHGFIAEMGCSHDRKFHVSISLSFLLIITIIKYTIRKAGWQSIRPANKLKNSKLKYINDNNYQLLAKESVASR